jgi:hypothetical protein
VLERMLLRRTKDATIADQLPCKSDNIVFCCLTPMQIRAYRCAVLVVFQRGSPSQHSPGLYWTINPPEN